MNQRNLVSIGLLVFTICSLNPKTASADNPKKKVSLEEQVTADLKALHQADRDALDQISVDEYRKSQRSLLLTEHHSLPPVSQEPQHLSLEQRHDLFINKYTIMVSSFQAVLQSHADLEKAIRAKQMTWKDAAAALKKWKTETDAIQTQLKGFNDEFLQIGQDYLDMYQDHAAAPPSEAENIIKPPGAVTH